MEVLFPIHAMLFSVPYYDWSATPKAIREAAHLGYCLRAGVAQVCLGGFPPFFHHSEHLTLLCLDLNKTAVWAPPMPSGSTHLLALTFSPTGKTRYQL